MACSSFDALGGGRIHLGGLSSMMMNIHTTPKMTTPPNTCLTSSKKKVQFGSASAAEFKSSRPTVELTPLTKDQAMKEFPLDKEIVEEEEEEHQ